MRDQRARVQGLGVALEEQRGKARVGARAASVAQRADAGVAASLKATGTALERLKRSLGATRLSEQVRRLATCCLLLAGGQLVPSYSLMRKLLLSAGGARTVEGGGGEACGGRSGGGGAAGDDREDGGGRRVVAQPGTELYIITNGCCT